MKELKNDIYDDETFFLSVDPEIIIRHKESFIKYILSDNPKYEDGDQHFRKDEVIMLKRYKIYNESNEDEEYKVCIEHPTDELHALCGANISDTLDGQPEETKDLINCEFCIQTIKAIIEGVCPGCFIGPPDCQCWNDK